MFQICQKDDEWVDQLPKKSKDIIKEALDVKQLSSRRGSLCKCFLIKWLNKRASEAI